MGKGDFKRLGKDVIFAELVNMENPGNISIGDNVEFKYGVYVEAWQPVEIGNNTHFAPYCVLYGPLSVGNNVAVAAHVVLASVGHGYDRTDIPMVEQQPRSARIVIEDDVWIGANATVVGGVRIGTGSIIGAGAVVTRDVEPYSVMGGVPAALIRKRKMG